MEEQHFLAEELFSFCCKQRCRRVSLLMGGMDERDAPGLPKSEAGALDAGYFKIRLKGMIAILSTYSPAELARECARLARRADPRVLQEDEFQ